LIGVVLGAALHWTVCPSIKRIWTPSWAVFSTGWTFYLLAAFYAIIDLAGYKRWAFPLAVVGMNSIAMYCMSQLMKPWIRGTILPHLNEPLNAMFRKPIFFETPLYGLEVLAGVFGPIWLYTGTLIILWLICLWMYRRKIFIRI